MELKRNKVFLTCDEWRLAGFPKPPGFDLNKHTSDELVTTVGISATALDIAQAQDEIYRYYESMEMRGTPPMQLTQIDSIAARLARTAGFDPFTLEPLNRSVKL